ncbi:MAG: proline--tRNA ligase [Anaerolineaceae bacterium]|nr:proline--tRNA ligase [Anaerolineaceae bacterium]
MRLSRLFFHTLREVPAESEIASHQLLLRAGFIRQAAAGIFSYLPLARRSMTRIENIMREEINAIGGQEVTMPVVQPADLWKETGRWYQIGSEMGRFKDKNDHDMVLAMTHEEVVSDLVRGVIRSHRQLPALIYHIQVKWRDDPRPRAGLMRVREFTMLDSYSLDRDNDGLERQYQAHYDAYFRIFNRCGCPTRAVQSDTGMMGGKLAHEYMYLTPVGEDTLLFCTQCDYSANRQVARFRRPVPPSEDPKPLEKVATPGARTIQELADFLGLSATQTAKAVFLIAVTSDGAETREQLVFAVVRGDMELNEYKLSGLLAQQIDAAASPFKFKELRPAQEAEIEGAGACPGYASPIGLNAKVKPLVIVDELAAASPNLVAGANEEGFHYLNTNHGRDYQADIIADIAAAYDGAACPECGSPMHAGRGVEVGNIFMLGTRYSDSMGCTYLDEDGSSKPVVMGSYGIGVGRLLACVAEEHHDEKGLCWPVSVAPYPIHMVALAGKTQDILPQAEKLYESLADAGLEPLYDDRMESPGVKFNDADLVGCPLRLTISERSMKQAGVEVRVRGSGETTYHSLENLPAMLTEMINALAT